MSSCFFRSKNGIYARVFRCSRCGWFAVADGIYMFVLQFAVMAIFQSDKLVIGTLLTPADVVPFSVVGRGFLIGYGIFIILLSPLWPAYGEAIRRGDIAWMRRGVRLATMVGCGGILIWGTTLLIAGKWVFPLWTRRRTWWCREPDPGDDGDVCPCAPGSIRGRSR